MPTYSYRRADGTTFDVEQRITEPALTACPTTGQAVTRMITGGAGLVFKGSGFYLTDYARKGNSASTTGPSAKEDAKPAAATNSDASGPSTSSGKTD